MRASWMLPALALMGCKSDYTMAVRSPGALELEVTSPTYGDFMGDEDVVVTGRAAPAYAVVTVEGEVVELDEDGNFELALPVGGPYNIVEVEASFGGEAMRERIPVFSGHDPTLTWPGAATGRFLPAGLEKLGEGLGAYVDSLGWEAQIDSVLPSYEGDYFDLIPDGVQHGDTVVTMVPTPDGLEMALVMPEVSIDYTADIHAFGYSDTISVGFSEVVFGATMVPELDGDGIITLAATNAVLDLGDAEFQILFLDGWILEWVTDILLGYIVEPLTDLVLGLVLDQLGVIELGGPFAFEFDLLGTPLSAALSDLYTDYEGMGLGLGIGIGESADMEPPEIPTPGEEAPTADGAHAAFALHEGLFQVLLQDTLIGMLAQDLQLGSPYGDLIGAGITELPGGDEAPDGEGWCLSIDPGEAFVVRMQEGVEPIAVAYMPDFQLEVGVMDDDGDCDDWLETSLALELGIMIEDGAALGFDISIAEGAVLDYGATDWEEEEVIAGLTDWFEGLVPTLLSLLGGSLDLDLNSMLGGLGADSPFGALLGDLQIAVVDSAPLENEDGTWTEGLYAVSLTLWE